MIHSLIIFSLRYTNKFSLFLIVTLLWQIVNTFFEGTSFSLVINVLQFKIELRFYGNARLKREIRWGWKVVESLAGRVKES